MDVNREIELLLIGVPEGGRLRLEAMELLGKFGRIAKNIASSGGSMEMKEAALEGQRYELSAALKKLLGIKPGVDLETEKITAPVPVQVELPSIPPEPIEQLERRIKQKTKKSHPKSTHKEG